MIAACQPKILSFHQPRFFEYAGGSGGWIDAYGYPFAAGGFLTTAKKMKDNTMIPVQYSGHQDVLCL